MMTQEPAPLHGAASEAAGDDAAISRPAKPRRRVLAAGALVLAVAAAAVAAVAQERPPMAGGHDHGGPMMPMFEGPPGHVVGHLDRLLDGLGLTDAQRGQIRQIGMAAAADLGAQRSVGRGLRERAAQVFTAQTVDAAAAENLRQEMLTQQDQSSKRVMQAMLDIAQVLTPAQRARLGERMRDRQAMMQDRGRRMQQPRPPGGAPRPTP